MRRMAQSNPQRGKQPQHAPPAESRPASDAPKPATPASATREDAAGRALAQILQAFPDIIAAQIAAARDGSHQHAKFLCEFAGLSAALATDSAAPDDSLARLLLDRLQIADQVSEPRPGRPSSMP